MTKKNLVGNRNGKLTIEQTWMENVSGKQRRRCLCRCDCGNACVVSHDNLRPQQTTSCGCARTKMIVAYNLKHGDASGGKASSLLVTWRNMLKRCYNEGEPRFRDWGGRGITVCQEWKDDYRSFKSWAIENGYHPDLTIERIDNDGNYCPSNCRWATRKEQSRNSRRNRLVTMNGETMCVSAWAEKLGVSSKNARQRLRRGWSPEEAFSAS